MNLGREYTELAAGMYSKSQKAIDCMDYVCL